MTPTEYARHRGCALNVVQYALRVGRLTRSATKDRKGRWTIDAAAADVEWAQTTKADRVPLTGPTSRQGDDVEAPIDYAAARLRREIAEAEKAEIAVAKLKGELVPAADVEAQWVADITAAKTKVLGVPSRLRLRDPSLTPDQIAIIEEELRDAVTDLAGAA